MKQHQTTCSLCSSYFLQMTFGSPPTFEAKLLCFCFYQAIHQTWCFSSNYYTSCCFFWCSPHCLTKTCIIDTKHRSLCSRGPEHSAASSDGAAPESCKANKICGWRSGWIGLEFTNLQCPVSIHIYIYNYIYMWCCVIFGRVPFIYIYIYIYPPTPRARGSAPRRLDSHFVLVAFECFGPVPPRDIANGFACWRGISRAIELLFFMDSKDTVRRVFLACALGSNPAGVRVFRNCASKGHLPMVLLAGEASHGR